MIIFFDTEFSNFKDLELISIGCISEDKKNKFYSENKSFDKNLCSDFVIDIVVPLLNLDKYGLNYKELKNSFCDWINSLDCKEVIFVADYSGDFTILDRLIKDGIFNKKISCQYLDKAFVNVSKERGFFDYKNISSAIEKMAQGMEDYFLKDPQMLHNSMFDAEAISFGWDKAILYLKR